jgi:hypothetical protein
MMLRNSVTAILVSMAVTACGNMNEDPVLTEAVVPALRGFMSSAEAAQRLRPVGAFPGVDPALIAGVTNPLMGVWIEPREALATMVVAARNGDVEVWRSADSGTMGLADGVLISTRGFVHDLHASDAASTRAALRNGQPADVDRLYVFLDTDYNRQEVRAVCHVAPMGQESLTVNSRRHAVIRFEESCRAGDESFTNIYWRDRHGPIIWQSRQWFGPIGGVIYFQRLIE